MATLNLSFDFKNPFTRKANPEKNLNRSMLPVQMQRIRQDSIKWRDAGSEAERAYFPFRVKMQQIFIDTILNPHVKACIDKRKELTLLREFSVESKDGKIKYDEVTELLKTTWFLDFMSMSLDAIFFGYSLISLGDIESNQFKELECIKRWNVSPDRLVVSPFEYITVGSPFMEVPYKDWHIYVKTSNDIGTSPCGYGLLYNVAIVEIFLRNLLGYNGDFVELYSQPFRVGKTNKIDLEELNDFEKAVKDMGSAGYAILDNNGDSIEFIETAKGGNGWQSYDNFEKRLEAKISKLILGHSDALDSTAGKLGAEQGEESPTSQALEDKQQNDGRFLKAIVEDELFVKMRNLGFVIPDDATFVFSNNKEKQEENEKFTALAVEIKKAGLQVDKDYYEKQTGIKLSEVAAVVPPINPLQPKQTVKDKITNLYK